MKSFLKFYEHFVFISGFFLFLAIFLMVLFGGKDALEIFKSAKIVPVAFLIASGYLAASISEIRYKDSLHPLSNLPMSIVGMIVWFSIGLIRSLI